MDITAKQVLELAAKYIGYKEKASNKDLYSFTDNAGCGNFTMFQAELDKAKFWNTPKNGYEWCTSFVAWCFWRIAGSEAKDILCLTGPYGASCVSWAKYYAAQARLFTKPQVGDQYFQKDTRDGLPCHTGIVESVNGSTFVTIEGNYLIMDYKQQIYGYISTCSGKVRDVFYELCQIINSVNEELQPHALMFLLENIFDIDSDNTRETAKNYYTDEEANQINEEFSKTNFREFLHEYISNASKENIEPIDFYTHVWSMLRAACHYVDKKTALALFLLADDCLIPYRKIGTGIEMSDETFSEIIDMMNSNQLADMKYILALHYPQKTQSTSLLVDTLLSLPSRESQAVFLATLIDTVTKSTKENIKESIDSL